MKTMKKTLELSQGLKITVERPYDMQDAVNEFKAGVEKLGGTVTQVQDEIAVSGVSVEDVMKLSSKLTEDLNGIGALGADYSGIEARVLAHEARVLAHTLSSGPFGFPSWAHIPAGAKTDRWAGMSSLSEVAKAMEPGRAATSKPKAKKVAQVAPDALSTWEFKASYLQRVYGERVHLVGQHFRGKLDQEVLGWKRQGNMALLVAEPDNPVDMNAVMVLMWNDQTKHWHHVGYVRATQAALLRGKWTGDYKNVMVARITDIPSNSDGHRGGRNVELTLTGEVRTYSGYSI